MITKPLATVRVPVQKRLTLVLQHIKRRYHGYNIIVGKLRTYLQNGYESSERRIEFSVTSTAAAQPRCQGSYSMCDGMDGWMDESGLYSAFNHSWSYHRLQVGVYVLDPSCTSLTCGQSL